MKPERSKFLSPAEFRALLAASRNAPGITTNRNYTLLCLAGNLGLRVQEAVALRVGANSPPALSTWPCPGCACSSLLRLLAAVKKISCDCWAVMC